MQKFVVVAGAALALGAFGTPAFAAEGNAPFLEGAGADWRTPTGNLANWRYSTLDQINAGNVGDLQVAWSFSTGVLRGHEGNPLKIGNMLYVHTPFPNNVYALNLDDGTIVWRYEPKQDPDVIPVMCCDTVNRGVEYGEGLIFLHQADTNLVALDAKTGEEKWKVDKGAIADMGPKKGETGTSAPLYLNGKVYVGSSGGEFGVRCMLDAFEAASGKHVWRGYSMGPDEDILMDPEKTTHLGKPVGKDSGMNTWVGDQWKIGGGCTWGWISADPELNLVYYGTGNPSTWNPVQRAKDGKTPMDNRWSMTIMARDADTGMAKWVYQKTPFDEWDYDGVNENILANIPVKGKETKVLVNFDRNGLGYTLDRESGALLVAEKYDPVVNWTTGVDMDPKSDTYGRPTVVPKYSTFQDGKGEDTNTTGICPAALGTKDQQPAAFSPKTNLFYVPTNHVCMDYEPFQVSYTAGQPYVGATLSMYPAPNSHGGMGNFIAWDASEGKIVWSIPEQFSVWSGALVTAGDVIFYGTLEGYLKAVDMDGKELYKFRTPSGIIGNVNTWEHGGKQYVSILSGVGGWAGIGLAAGLTDPQAGLGAVGGYAGLSNYTRLGGTLMVFSLP